MRVTAAADRTGSAAVAALVLEDLGGLLLTRASAAPARLRAVAVAHVGTGSTGHVFLLCRGVEWGCCSVGGCHGYTPKHGVIISSQWVLRHQR